MTDPVSETPPGSVETPVSEEPSGSPAGNEGSSGDRKWQEVRGELLRKHDKLAEQVMQIAQGVSQLIEKSSQPAPGATRSPYTPQASAAAPQAPVSQYGAPRQLDNFSDDQLEVALQTPSVPENQRIIIRRELEERRQDRRLDQRLDQRERLQRVNGLKQQSESAALASFPALRDPSSEFSRRVEADLKHQRAEYGEFPTDKFDVANRVARAMGLEVTRAVVPGYTAPAGGGNDRNDRREVEETVLKDTEIEALARKFENAGTMPIDIKNGRGVRRKFDKAKIKDLSRGYGEAQGAYRNRGIKVRG